MPNYRRIFVPGGTYYFTVATYNRQPIFNNPNTQRLLRKSIMVVMEKHPFCEVAHCILPDHIHTIWTLPEGDSDYPMRWRAIKGNFSRWYQESIKPFIVNNNSHQKRKEAAIWQRRYWEHFICDDFDFDNHMDYIHFNPVKHGLVTRPRDWKWSSFAFHVRNEYYPADWGEDASLRIPDDKYGE
jgi:putative transposase